MFFHGTGLPDTVTRSSEVGFTVKIFSCAAVLPTIPQPYSQLFPSSYSPAVLPTIPQRYPNHSLGLPRVNRVFHCRVSRIMVERKPGLSFQNKKYVMRHKVGCRVCARVESSRFRPINSVPHEALQHCKQKKPESEVLCDNCSQSLRSGRYPMVSHEV